MNRKTLSILALSSMLAFSVTASFACGCGNKAKTDEPVSFLAIPVPAATTTQARLTTQDKTIVASYIDEQIKANNITRQQFEALTPSQQRLVLMPGSRFNLSREERRTLIPMKKALPYSISKQLVANNTLAQNTIDMYGITLPASVEGNLPSLASGNKRIILGDRLLIINDQNIIQDVMSDLY